MERVAAWMDRVTNRYFAKTAGPSRGHKAFLVLQKLNLDWLRVAQDASPWVEMTSTKSPARDG